MTVRALLIIAALLCSGLVFAASVPDPTEQEALIKTTLLAFNRANVTGNYTAFHASLAKVARDRFGPDQLADIFKEFRIKHIDIDVISREKPMPAEAAAINDDGILTLKGSFRTRKGLVVYDLMFDQSEGQWKPGAVQVDTKDWKN
jgi:hypothetical protein